MKCRIFIESCLCREGMQFRSGAKRHCMAHAAYQLSSAIKLPDALVETKAKAAPPEIKLCLQPSKQLHRLHLI